MIISELHYLFKSIIIGSHLLIKGPAGSGKLNCIQEACKRLDVPVYRLLMSFSEPGDIKCFLTFNSRTVLILDELDRSSRLCETAILQLMEQNKDVTIIALITDDIDICEVMKKRLTLMTC